MTTIDKKAAARIKREREKRKADLARFKRNVETTRINLASEKSSPTPNRPRDLAILQEAHDHAKEVYAELQASPL
jgi:hypothetical protein